jgi:predicted CopG family antitoxin
MSRQLRISDDVHEMLTLLKPHNSTSYDDIIRDLITDVCPYLPRIIENLRLLEQTNPREAAGERLLLQKEIVEEIIVNRMLRQTEAQEERQLDRHLDSIQTDEQKSKDKQFRQRLEQMRHDGRQKILLETQSTKKDAR